MERVLGVDYGRRRVGLAVTDALGIAAHPRDTLEVRDFEDAVARVAASAREEEAGRIVLGLPVNMDGSEGPMAKEVRDFAAALAAATKLPVETIDERLTSWEAEDALKEAGLSWKKRKGKVDKVAAVLILRAWMAR